MAPREYQPIADMPELIDSDGDGGIVLAMPDGDLDRLVAAVAARRCPGARLEEKKDGAWVRLTIGADGLVAAATSRSGLGLKAARPWLGQRVHHIVAGWTLVGELERYTPGSVATRDDPENAVGLVWVHSAWDRRGRPVDHDRLLRVLRRGLHSRLAPIPECPWSADWAAWTRVVIEAGGEGVVVKLPDGTCYRAKPRRHEDRVVVRAYREADHNDVQVNKADVGAYVGGQLRALQTVLVPARMGRAVRRGRVVLVAGPSMSADGVVRHGRIVEVRDVDDKQPQECTL